MTTSLLNTRRPREKKQGDARFSETCSNLNKKKKTVRDLGKKMKAEPRPFKSCSKINLG